MILSCMVVLPSREDLVTLLNDELSQITGIISTETSIVLKFTSRMIGHHFSI